MMAESGAILDRRCGEIGRDPASIHRTAAALVFASRDEARLATLRSRDTGRPTLIGTPAELADEMRAYEKAGVHELIVPGFAYRSSAEAEEALGLIMEGARAL